MRKGNFLPYIPFLFVAIVTAPTTFRLSQVRASGRGMATSICGSSPTVETGDLSE